MAIKRSIDELNKEIDKYKNIDEIIDILAINIKNKNINITNIKNYHIKITNNIIHPLKKYKKADIFLKDDESYININIKGNTIFSNNNIIVDRQKINTINYPTINEIICKKENQIKNINLINYEKIKTKLLKYYTLLNILKLNNDIISFNINKFLTEDITNHNKYLINIHQTLNIYYELSINDNNKNLNFIKNLLILYSQYLLLLK